MRQLLWLIALIVPRPIRPRWREEWRAEIHYAGARGRLTAMRMAAGSVLDATAIRRLATGVQWVAGPRAGVWTALSQDFRYALRTLSTAPGFTAGVVLSLALGIGANTAAFSFINAAVFRPFPAVRDQHELVRLTVGPLVDQRFSTVATSYQDFVTLREGLTTLTGLSALRDANFAVLKGGTAAAVPGALVSGNYFTVLGVTPAAGRFFRDDEDRTAGTHPVAVISDALWPSLYARSPSAIGGTLIVNGAPLVIVGVTPRDFIGVRKGNPVPRIWVPMAMGEITLRASAGGTTAIAAAGPLWLDYVGRRRGDLSLADLRAQSGAVGARLESTRATPRSRVTVQGVWLNDPATTLPAIVGFLAVPMLVLAIACVNAANLLTARASRRVRDWTVRFAVGATRWRVVRQVLVEAVMLSTAAAALGLILTLWALSLVADQVPVPMPLDHRVALFTVTLAVLAAVTFSVGPALSVTSRAATRLGHASVVTGAVRTRARFLLVGLQAALSLGLLATGAQFTKTVQFAAAAEHIPEPEHLILASFDVDPLRLDRDAGDDLYRRLLERVRRSPGVAAAGLAPDGLVTGALGRDRFARVWLPVGPAEGLTQLAFVVTPGLLEAIGVPQRAGRRFMPPDEDRVRTVVVNKAFEDTHLQGHALGRTFRLGAPPEAPQDGIEATVAIVVDGVPTYKPHPGGFRAADALDVTVVGVVEGIVRPGTREPPIVYYPAPLVYQPARTLYVRLDRTGTFTAAALHAAIRDVDGRIPIVDVATLAELRHRKDSGLMLLTQAVGVLGILALVLAAGGLYSVVAYIVSLRRQEVGIRLALGADAGSIVGMIVRQALLPTVLGAIAGAAGAAGAGTLIRSRLYGVSPVDPVAFGGATVLMLCVMTLASWLPARQAGRVDPLAVLRQD